MKRTEILLLLFGVCMLSLAQVKVDVSIDPQEILVGEQSRLTVSVTMKEGQTAQFPIYKYAEPLVPGVEVLEVGAPDTARTGDQQLKVTQVYTLTSFDDTLYYLPPMEVKVDGKGYPSKNLALKVLTIEIDTLHPNQFFPPKTVQTPPFDWSEWAPLFWLSVLALLLMALVAYLYGRLRDNKPIISRIRIIKHVPAHQKAMQAIEKIKADNADMAYDQKEYYTRLTDTLRTYLEERFGIQAMEMTSGEIIEQLRNEEDQSKIEELRQLLETADLVKFAKHSALLDERGRNMASVVDFIQTTKRDEQPTIEKVEPQLTDSERRTRRSRTIIITLITLLSLAAVALLVYVIWQAAAVMLI